MAGNSITAASVLMCPHGGTVQITATGASTAGGAQLATAADLFLVAGCPLVIGVVPSPCISVVWLAPDLRVRTRTGQTLSQSSVGLCIGATGAVQGAVVVAATQPKVSTQ